jgi:hypothetical protein
LTKGILFSISFFICGLVWGQTAGDSVTVKLFWNYDALPKEMRVFELKSGEKKRLWDTDMVKEPGALPIGEPIPEDTLLLKPGQNKKFVLVFKNTTDKTLNFFAAPHQMKPEANALGYKFKCLCINRVYEVKPGWYWYRVVEMRVSPQVSGTYLEVTHSLFGVTVEKARGLKFQPMGNMDMDQGM